jgi:hypothetical protein
MAQALPGGDEAAAPAAVLERGQQGGQQRGAAGAWLTPGMLLLARMCGMQLAAGVIWYGAPCCFCACVRQYLRGVCAWMCAGGGLVWQCVSSG